MEGAPLYRRKSFVLKKTLPSEYGETRCRKYYWSMIRNIFHTCWYLYAALLIMLIGVNDGTDSRTEVFCLSKYSPVNVKCCRGFAEIGCNDFFSDSNNSSVWELERFVHVKRCFLLRTGFCLVRKHFLLNILR